MGQLVGCIKGMSAACTALDFPVVSGNVSLYNETQGQAILPTPAVGGIGILENLDCFADLALCRAEDGLLLIGKTQGHLEQSVYLQQLLGVEDGAEGTDVLWRGATAAADHPRPRRQQSRQLGAHLIGVLQVIGLLRLPIHLWSCR